MILDEKNSNILNALRMGVIPNINLEQILVGNEAEKEELNKYISAISNEACSKVKFIKGEHGTGKTFLLNYLKQKAIENDFVVASVSITSGFNFSKLDIVYNSIVNNLSIDTNLSVRTDFEQLIDLWISKLKNLSQDIYQVISEISTYNTAFSNVLLTYIRAKINNDYELTNAAISWIKGDKNISHELKKQLKIKGSIDKENATQMLKGFIKLLTLIGYKGIIIQIDEAELIMNERLDIREKSYNNIKHIVDLCSTGEIENCYIVFAGTHELYNNKEKGFKSNKALGQRLGENIKSGRISNVRQPIITLNDFKEKDLITLTNIVIDIHQNYYNYVSPIDTTSIYNLVIVECMKINNSKMNIRKYIKKLLEIIDLMQENPNLPIFNSRVQAIRK